MKERDLRELLDPTSNADVVVSIGRGKLLDYESSVGIPVDLSRQRLINNRRALELVALRHVPTANKLEEWAGVISECLLDIENGNLTDRQIAINDLKKLAKELNHLATEL